MRRDIDEAMQGWPFEPETGVARQIKARDGRPILQIRVELGLLQMEVEGRPDGVRPHGFPTYLDYLRGRAASKGSAAGFGSKGKGWSMSKEQRAEADREFVQFDHRRGAWLELQKYDKALDDADHSLELMDFILQHGQDPEYVAAHERLRGLVIFHRTHPGRRRARPGASQAGRGHRRGPRRDAAARRAPAGLGPRERGRRHPE